jgi:hypothetical protein
MDNTNFLSNDYNLYRYVLNNPYKWVDPFGEFASLSIIAIISATWILICESTAISRSSTIYPGDDRRQHCYTSCFFNRCMLNLAPNLNLLGGIFHEVLVPRYGIKDAVGDIKANIYGIVGSYSFKSCKEKCDKCPDYYKWR